MGTLIHEWPWSAPVGALKNSILHISIFHFLLIFVHHVLRHLIFASQLSFFSNCLTLSSPVGPNYPNVHNCEQTQHVAFKTRMKSRLFSNICSLFPTMFCGTFHSWCFGLGKHQKVWTNEVGETEPQTQLFSCSLFKRNLSCTITSAVQSSVYSI